VWGLGEGDGGGSAWRSECLSVCTHTAPHACVALDAEPGRVLPLCVSLSASMHIHIHVRIHMHIFISVACCHCLCAGTCIYIYVCMYALSRT
jgi:hypothetical protein